MSEFFTRLLDTSDYPARWNCGNWTAFEGWLHIISDSAIFVAYATIPTTLAILLRKRKDTAFPAVGVLFVAFILSCGITHALDAAIFWWPAYRLSGLAKFITAIASLSTAIALVSILPRALALPSIARANAELQAALARELTLHEQLAAAHRKLEDRTSTLAVRDRRTRDALRAARACPVVWEIDSGRIVWSDGFRDAVLAAGLSWHGDDDHWHALVGPQAADDLARAARDPASTRGTMYWAAPVHGLAGKWEFRLAASLDAPVKDQPRTMSGVARLAPTTAP